MSSPSSPSGGGRAQVMDLVRDTIERDYPDWHKQSDEQSGLAPDAMGWTIDLSHHDIRILPEEVVHILEDNVRRLAIGHNRLVSIPTCLANCQNLRYFNARNNDIHVFPGALLQMQNLEIIDLSDNKMVGIPEAIDGMPALNALAIASNKIERLPSCLWRMKKLRMIKVHGNPLQYPPAQILEVDPDVFDSKIPNAYEMAMTTKVKEWLYSKHKEKMARMRADLSPGRTRPVALDIAKASRRAHGTRFPVKPSLSGISIEPPADTTRFGPLGRTVSFETPDSATTPINVPQIPPRSESRTTPSLTSMSPEGAVPISTQRPRLATLAPSWPVDQAAVPTSERSHTDSLLQTSNRSHRQARVWRETQSRKETRQVKYENKRSTEQMGMAYPINDTDFTKELLVRLPQKVMEDLDEMVRNVLGLWIDVSKSTNVIQVRFRDWYNRGDDQDAVGQALVRIFGSLRTTQLHLTGYYNFEQSIPDYMHNPTTESLRIKFPYGELEQWTNTLIHYRHELEKHRNSLFERMGLYAANLRLLPPPGGDGERYARAESVDRTLKISLFMTWQARKSHQNDALAQARVRISNRMGPGDAPPVVPLPQVPIFSDQEHPYAPIYDKMSAAIELTERIAQHSPPDPDRIPAWRAIAVYIRLFHSLFPEGDSEKLRNVVWRFGHSIVEFQAQGLDKGDGALLKEFLEPIDMVIEAVRMYPMMGFAGR